MTARRSGIPAVAAYCALIVLANWALARYGFVPVGFGLVAPAGTYFAGAVFVARDVAQLTLGRRWVLAAIAVGAALSWWTSPAFAAASGLSFLVGETIDFAVYTPLADRGRLVSAFLLADTAGLLVDTFLFLTLAFGTTAHWQGTAVGKEWETMLVLPAVWWLRTRWQPRTVPA